MKKQHFFIVGGQRCGSTLMYHLLNQHPQICMAQPVRPEPKFFLPQWKPQDVERDELLDIYYKKHFQHLKDELILGDKSVSYCEVPGMAELFKSIFPEAKIIFLFRDPVERAISNFHFSRNNNTEPRSLEEVFIQKKPNPPFSSKISVSPFNYLGRGVYLEFYNRFVQVFGKAAIQVIVHEELLKNPQPMMQESFRLLGANEDFSIDFPTDKVNSEPRSIEKDEAEVRAFLKTYYQTFNEELANELSLDLSSWA